MMRKFVGMVLIALLGTLALAQSSKNAQGFCQNDPRPEIVAFCKDLAALLSAVNAEKSASQPDLTIANGVFDDPLQKLNLASPKAVDDFITATAADFALNSAIANAIRDAGQARPDRQLSPGSSSNGTTTLVSTAGSAEFLALALNTGAMTQSINGTTGTLTANADELFRLITGNQPGCIAYFSHCSSLGWIETKVLNRTNFLASLDLGQTSTQTVATTGQAVGTAATPVSSATIPSGAGRLASFNARYQVMNKFDPRGGKFQTAWAKQVTSLKASVEAVGDDTDAVYALLQPHLSTMTASQINDHKNDLLSAAAADPSGGALKDAFHSYWGVVINSDVLRDAQLASAVSKATQDRAVYRQAWYKALDNAVGNLFTFDYTFNRPLNQPETHDFKAIYAYNFQTTGMITFNGALSIYGTLPAGAIYGRVHYGQVSSQYDRTLTGKDSGLQTQLSLAGYWQYQPEPSVLNIPAGTVAPGTSIPLPNGTQEFVGTAGSLWVTQAKVTIKGAGGINVPIGVTWSNKTDLLQGSRVGGQVGISYNFTSIANLFSGSGNSQ